MSFRSHFGTLARDFLPPILIRALRKSHAPPPIDPQGRAMDEFYAGLIRPGALCFDIGANAGVRVASLRRLGSTVVALEPQSKCFAKLERLFGRDEKVVLLKQAAGAIPGSGEIMISDNDLLSSLSPEFIAATTRSGRFAGAKWEGTETVRITTLDDLIEQYGVPEFVKVDVEGFELAVVQGLSRPLKLMALEWAPEMTDNLLACADLLGALAPTSFNISWGESLRLARTEWLDRTQLESVLNVFRDEKHLFADIYVRTAT